LRSYKIQVRPIREEIGHVKLANLTRSGVEELKTDLLKAHSHSKAKNAIAALKALLKHAQKIGAVAQNVARDVDFLDNKRHRVQIKSGVNMPTPEDVRAMLRHCEGLGDSKTARRWRPLFVTAVFTSMRASELRGLRWHDVDLEAKEITVRQRADRWNEIGAPKSKAGKRRIPLSPMVVNTLREWKVACPPSALDLVFPTNVGTVLRLTNIESQFWHPMQRACGLVDGKGKPRYGFHTLRHFFASWCIDQGFPWKRLQAIMGHSTITMTIDTYGHLLGTDGDQDLMAAGEAALLREPAKNVANL